MSDGLFVILPLSPGQMKATKVVCNIAVNYGDNCIAQYSLIPGEVCKPIIIDNSAIVIDYNGKLKIKSGCELKLYREAKEKAKEKAKLRLQSYNPFNRHLFH